MTVTDIDPAFEELLEFVRETRGFDYGAYKRPTLMRRVEKRLQAVGAETYDAYRDYLEAEPREFGELFDTILINVTSFFRDPPAWDFVRTTVLPPLLEEKDDGEPIRVWSAGCSSGQEAYTAAMLLAAELGEDEYRKRVKIYATDIDEDALTEGRHGRYPHKAVEAVPEDLRERYFQEVDGGWAIAGDLRRSVIFGRNDLLTDAPISRVDLLISRNTLMYFAPAAQMRVLSNFFFALNRTGYLFFGKAETFQTRTSLFHPLEQRQRVFVKNPRAAPEPRVAVEAIPETVALAALHGERERLRDVGFDHSPLAQLLVDVSGRLTLANNHARLLFGLTADDVGRPLQDLELSYRPVELRSHIDQALAERRMVSVRDAVWDDAAGESHHFDVQVAPLVEVGGGTIGTTITFFDVSRAEGLRQELDRAKRELETAYEELQSTVEELETTNEELQSTNEELETTNEELQSTNEELETMNEELQSTNEELETMNDELRERTDEALAAHSFLGAVLGNVHQSVVVLDSELRVLAWNDAAADLWGVRADEVVGSFFLNLDIGLPVGELRAPIRRTLAGETPDDLILEARNRRGQPIACTVDFAQLTSHTGEVNGVILVMTGEPREEPIES